MSDILSRQPCPDCGALLQPFDGPTHRYLGASAACWALFGALANGGEPPLAPAATNALLVDAYAAQHPGVSSPQATQSVAVHLLALHGVLERSLAPERVLWVRRKVLDAPNGRKHERFHWLTPPDLTESITVVDVIQELTPKARSVMVAEYVRTVWQLWAEAHGEIVRKWYDQYVFS